MKIPQLASSMSNSSSVNHETSNKTPTWTELLTLDRLQNHVKMFLLGNVRSIELGGVIEMVPLFWSTLEEIAVFIGFPSQVVNSAESSQVYTNSALVPEMFVELQATQITFCAKDVPRYTWEYPPKRERINRKGKEVINLPSQTYFRYYLQ